MARTLKIAAVVVAIVVVLTLAVSGTIYALGGDRCAPGDSGCAQQHRAGCIGSGPCSGSGDCTAGPNCRAGGQS